MTFVKTVDYHTGGEPFRIVPHPPVELRGATVAERRVFAGQDPAADGLRRLLCHEPRGHADMYGGFITDPDDGGARFGVLFWHKDGFSTACGHGTIALGAWAVRSGLVTAPPDGSVDVRIDVPSGRVTARVHLAQGRVVAVDFVSVASYPIATRRLTTSRGEIEVAVSFGGAIYAQADVAGVGLRVVPEHHQELIALGREIKRALHGDPAARHPVDERLSGVYGTILYESLGTTDAGELHQRNVTIFADGELDRSPCGSGTAARVATLRATGELGERQTLVHDSIVGSRFTAVATPGPGGSVIPVITGMAYPTGEHVFTVDPEDPMTPGFVLR
ncbi:proline racemase family protein [Dactylosporangium sp. NPDC000244]|uniref:proline racemase family protein n=1 Tax=Dactylosporangium sp. NPDC000244 TaxID=3154365 RepID=UPI00332C6133